MFSPGKILLLAVALVVVWWLWRMIEGRNAGRGSGEKSSGTVDLVRCPTCGDWVEDECGKPGCSGSGGGEG